MEPEKLIYKLRDLKAAHPRLIPMEKYNPGFVGELVSVQQQARDFARKHVDPVALEIDAKIEADSNWFPWDVVRAALPYRFLSYIIPKPFGGVGYLTTHFAVLMEELCAHCPGIANIFGAHALGLSPLLMSPDIRHYAGYMGEVAEAEKKGEPVIFALAITEPGAGSDVEDKEELATAHLSTFAKKVDGGYILNGRKVFISNGGIARYTWVGGVMDRKNPVESVVSFVVPDDAKGFSVGRVEKKLGQRACPAAELIFEDVFIPEKDRVGDEGEGEKLISAVLGGSRAPVAAIATGIARGAFERLLLYLNDNKVNGRYLFEEQWVQLALADLMTKLQISRALYLDATMCCDALGVPKLMSHPSMKMLDLVPRFIMMSAPVRRLFSTQRMYKFVKNLAEKNVSPEDVALVASLSSIAKYTASDLAMEITSKAIDIAGPDGPLREYGLEKAYRDAKLTQIYEGTNQVNRLFAFKNLFLQ